jgi:uncharacterized coiled-coil DUF342 family protein
LCKENKELKEELDDTLNDCVNQDKELNQLNEELKRNEKEITLLRKSLAGLNTTNPDLHKTVNRYKSQQSNAMDLRQDISDIRDENTELRNGLVKSEELVAQLHETVNDLNLGICGLRNELVRTRENHDKLLGDNMKLSEEIDSMTSGEDSLSLEELKDIKFCVNHFQLIFPNLFHKLTSMIERHDVPTPKEMTVEEIEKQLGHSIKVVK